jgi:hypothetical protein
MGDFHNTNKRTIHLIKNITQEASKELTVVFQKTISQQCSGKLKGNRKEQGVTTDVFLHHRLFINILNIFKNLAMNLTASVV